MFAVNQEDYVCLQETENQDVETSVGLSLQSIQARTDAP